MSALSPSALLVLTLITNSCVLTFLSVLPLFPQLHFEVPLSPVIAAKKARPSDGGSDEVCDVCDTVSTLSSLTSG